MRARPASTAGNRPSYAGAISGREEHAALVALLRSLPKGGRWNAVADRFWSAAAPSSAPGPVA